MLRIVMSFFSDEPRRAQSMRKYLPDACDYAPENVYLKFHLFSMKTKTRLKNSTQFNKGFLCHIHILISFRINIVATWMTLFYDYNFFFDSIHLKGTEKYFGLTLDDIEGFYLFLFYLAILKCYSRRFVSILWIKTKLTLLVDCFFLLFFF